MRWTQRSPSGRAGVRDRGFTLVELLIVMVVLGIMMGIAVPSFKSFVAGQQVKTASYDLMMALVLARSEAIKRNTNVTIAPDTADDWVSGWTIKTTIGGVATTLVQQQALTGVTITEAPSTVTYGSNGRPNAASNFEVAGSGSTSLRCVKVDLTGIPSTQTAACP